jgi:hypothetical protein
VNPVRRINREGAIDKRVSAIRITRELEGERSPFRLIFTLGEVAAKRCGVIALPIQEGSSDSERDKAVCLDLQ